jgi:hypothetical protein
MNWQEMLDKAKQVFQQRGGAKAAKEDAQELKDISQEQGSTADKAKQAAEAIREPGAHDAGSTDAPSQEAGDVQQQT